MRVFAVALLGVVACGSPAAPAEDLGPDGPCFMCEMGAGTPPDASAPFVPIIARLVQPPCEGAQARFVVAAEEFECGETPATYYEIEPLGELDNVRYAVDARSLRARFCENGSCERVLGGTLQLRRLFGESPRLDLSLTRLDGVMVAGRLDAAPGCFGVCDDPGTSAFTETCGEAGEDRVGLRVAGSCDAVDGRLRFEHPDTLFSEGGAFPVGIADLEAERCEGETCLRAIDGFLRYESFPSDREDAVFHWLVQLADGTVSAGRDGVDVQCTPDPACD